MDMLFLFFFFLRKRHFIIACLLPQFTMVRSRLVTDFEWLYSMRIGHSKFVHYYTCTTGSKSRCIWILYRSISNIRSSLGIDDRKLLVISWRSLTCSPVLFDELPWLLQTKRFFSIHGSKLVELESSLSVCCPYLSWSSHNSDPLLYKEGVGVSQNWLKGGFKNFFREGVESWKGRLI